MDSFPLLRTGAVMQYPAQKQIQYSTQIVRFLDGSEQRFRGYGQPIRRWVIRLLALDESELSSLRAFFRSQSGAYGSFAYTDPWDGTQYPDCSLETDEMIDRLIGEGSSSTTLIVKENRS